jgi:hypothetical protein
MGNAVPVLYYHRVNRVDRRMAVAPELFLAQMRQLQKSGWKALTMAELMRFIETGEKPGPRCLAITFDDGFADNYYYALPALRETGMKAVFFLITERVGRGPARKTEAEQVVRPFDEANKAALAGDLGDYLRASEIREMAAGGAAEFGSHTVRHAPCFKGPAIERFILSSSPHWARQVLAQGDLRPGVPLYEWASAVAVRRYVPDPAVKERLAAFMREHGGLAAVKESGKQFWTKKLREEARIALEASRGGEMESEGAAQKRVLEELKKSREAVREFSGAPCLALCWPWGHYSGLGVEAAEKAGYELAFSTEPGAVVAESESFTLNRMRVSSTISPRALDLMLGACSLARSGDQGRRSEYG